MWRHLIVIIINIDGLIQFLYKYKIITYEVTIAIKLNKYLMLIHTINKWSMLTKQNLQNQNGME